MVGIKNRNTLKYEDKHKEIDGLSHKLCSCHNEWFPEEDGWLPMNEEYFYKNKSSTRDGYSPYCKKCSRLKSMKYLKENEEATSKYNKKRYRKNIDYYRDNQRKKILRNPQKYKLLTSEWRKNNPDKIKGYNKKREKEKTHKISTQEWEDCKKYFNHRCAYCGLPIEEHYYTRNNTTKLGDLHKEHIIDCGKNNLKNCVPSCKSCNSEKGSISFNDWYNSNNPKYSREKYLKIYQWVRYDCKKFIKIMNNINKK